MNSDSAYYGGRNIGNLGAIRGRGNFLEKLAVPPESDASTLGDAGDEIETLLNYEPRLPCPCPPRSSAIRSTS